MKLWAEMNKTTQKAPCKPCFACKGLSSYRQTKKVLEYLKGGSKNSVLNILMVALPLLESVFLQVDSVT